MLVGVTDGAIVGKDVEASRVGVAVGAMVVTDGSLPHPCKSKAGKRMATTMGIMILDFVVTLWSPCMPGWSPS